jgi:hypothetical protein
MSRREAAYYPIHAWRWRALYMWIGVFSTIVILSLVDLRGTTASVKSLQKTNCDLRNFLITARSVRLRAGDETAARAYERLIQPFNRKAVGKCPPPRKVGK